MNLSKNYEKNFVRKSYTTKDKDQDKPGVHFENKSLNYSYLNDTKQFTPKANTGFHYHHNSMSMAKGIGEESMSKRDYETLRNPKEGNRLLENRTASTIKKEQLQNKSKSLLDKSRLLDSLSPNNTYDKNQICSPINVSTKSKNRPKSICFVDDKDMHPSYGLLKESAYDKRSPKQLSSTQNFDNINGEAQEDCYTRICLVSMENDRLNNKVNKLTYD